LFFGDGIKKLKKYTTYQIHTQRAEEPLKKIKITIKRNKMKHLINDLLKKKIFF